MRAKSLEDRRPPTFPQIPTPCCNPSPVEIFQHLNPQLPSAPDPVPKLRGGEPGVANLRCQGMCRLRHVHHRVAEEESVGRDLDHQSDSGEPFARPPQSDLSHAERRSGFPQEGRAETGGLQQWPQHAPNAGLLPGQPAAMTWGA